MTYYHAPQNKGACEDPTASQPDTSENFAYFPAFIHVTGKKIIVLGGGEVALGKLRLLTRSQADITVVAAEICDDITVMVDEGRIVWESAPFVDTMINGAAMVFDAADDPHLTARVQTATKRRNILLNVVDKTPHCDFIVPAILDRAPVMITISTGACAPALARIIRQRLETVLPNSLSRIARVARDARQRVAAALPDSLSRQRFWTGFFQSALRTDAKTEITQTHLDRDLQNFVPQGSSTTVPAGQFLRVSMTATNAYDIAHGIARNIETADIIVHEKHEPADILALARRDASLIKLDASAIDENIDKQIKFFTQQGMNVMRLCRT